MLKYYYLVNTSGKNCDYTDVIENSLYTLYIVDTNDKCMNLIYNEFIKNECDEIREDCDYSSDISIDDECGDIILEGKKYKDDRKLRKLIKKKQKIKVIVNNLSIKPDSPYINYESYLEFIKWLYCNIKYDLIDFTHYIMTKNKDSEQSNPKNDLEFKTVDCICLLKMNHTEDSKSKHVNKYYYTYNMDNDLVFNYFKNYCSKYIIYINEFSNDIELLPSNAKNVLIEINHSNHDNHENPLYISFDKLPTGIDKLMIHNNSYDNHDNCYISLDKIQDTLQELEIKFSTNGGEYITPDNLPCNLKKLKIDIGSYNNPINNLPITLEELDITSYEFNQSIDYLPVNLRILKINSNSFNQSMDNLPPNLEILELTSLKYDKNLDNLPQSLKSIYLSIEVPDDLKLDLTKLPKQLIHFMCESPYKSLNSNLILPSNFIIYKKLQRYYKRNGGYTISSSEPANMDQWGQL